MKVYEWAKVPAEEIRRGVVRRGFATPHVMLVYHELSPGMETRPHRHPFEQVVHVLSGEVVFTVDGERHPMPPGSVCCIPPNALHFIEVTGKEVALTLDVFAPPREDYAHLTTHQQP